MIIPIAMILIAVIVAGGIVIMVPLNSAALRVRARRMAGWAYQCGNFG